MSDLLKIPPEAISQAAWLSRLRQVAQDDLPTARQAAMLRLLWQEAYFTRPGLIARIEAILWPGCFDPAPDATFQCDLNFVRQRLAAAGHQARYSRRPDRPGYYLKGRPTLDPHLKRLISGAVAEVDPAQIAIYGRLTPAQRLWQLAHLSDWLQAANERRLQLRKVA